MGTKVYLYPFLKEQNCYCGVVWININDIVLSKGFIWIDEGEKDMFVDILADKVPLFNNTFDIVIDRNKNNEIEFHCHERTSMLSDDNITGGIRYTYIASSRLKVFFAFITTPRSSILSHHMVYLFGQHYNIHCESETSINQFTDDDDYLVDKYGENMEL